MNSRLTHLHITNWCKHLGLFHCLILVFTLFFINQAAISETSPAKVSLVTKFDRCLPDSPCQFGVLFELEPGWHIYWKNPGDSGAAPRFSFISPPHLKEVHFSWPTPSRIPVQHLVNFGYEDKVLLPFVVSPEKNAQSINVLIKGEWLVCKEDCIPFDGEFHSTQAIGPDLNPTQYTSIFNSQEEPKKNSELPISEKIGVGLSESKLELLIPYPVTEPVYFFPAEKHIAESSVAPSVLVEDHHTRVEILTKKLSGKDLYAENLLQIGNKVIAFSILNQQDTPPEQSRADDEHSVSLLFCLAFLGGIILNLMPCVLPVLAIKAVQFVNASTETLAGRAIESLSYIAGVVVSMLTLFGFVLLAKASGESLGWGFQFQSPWFSAFCALVFTLLGLNLLGIFEFPLVLPQRLLRMKGSTKVAEGFISGIGTTIISTPCTAPFAGASIAYALQASAFEGATIFLGLALGLALPFSLAYLFPRGIRKVLPKPGAWMGTFKKICAVPMFLTAAWLVLVVCTQIQTQPDGVYVDSWGQKWEPYSEEIINQVQQKGETAYLDFTASWCITCQVNKTVVFSDSKVRDFIATHKIKLIRADWTRKDEAIGKALKSFNRVSVPLNIVYRKENPPLMLPTLLSPSDVLNALKE